MSSAGVGSLDASMRELIEQADANQQLIPAIELVRLTREVLRSLDAVAHVDGWEAAVTDLRQPSTASDPATSAKVSRLCRTALLAHVADKQREAARKPSPAVIIDAVERLTRRSRRGWVLGAVTALVAVAFMAPLLIHGFAQTVTDSDRELFRYGLGFGAVGAVQVVVTAWLTRRRPARGHAPEVALLTLLALDGAADTEVVRRAMREALICTCGAGATHRCDGACLNKAAAAWAAP